MADWSKFLVVLITELVLLIAFSTPQHAL